MKLSVKKSTRLTALRGEAKAQCLQACLIPHAPESTGRNLHLTGSGLFCTDPALVLTQAIPLHFPLPHWNYSELLYARLQQEELSEFEPNPACTRTPKEAGGGKQLCERTKEPNPNSQPPTGRKEAPALGDASQWHIPE